MIRSALIAGRTVSSKNHGSVGAALTRSNCLDPLAQTPFDISRGYSTSIKKHNGLTSTIIYKTHFLDGFVNGSKDSQAFSQSCKHSLMFLLPQSSLVSINRCSTLAVTAKPTQNNSLNIIRSAISKVINDLVSKKAYIRAETVFKQMETLTIEPDPICYNSLLKCYAKMGNEEKVEKVIEKMKRTKGVDFTEATYFILIHYFGKLRKMERVQELFEEFKTKFQPNVFIYAALIKTYGHIGDRPQILKYLKEMRSFGLQPQTFTFNVLLEFFGRTKDYVSFQETLKKMEAQGVYFNHHTYRVLISIASEQDDLEKMEKYLEVMRKKNMTIHKGIGRIFVKYFRRAKDLENERRWIEEMERLPIKY